MVQDLLSSRPSPQSPPPPPFGFFSYPSSPLLACGALALVDAILTALQARNGDKAATGRISASKGSVCESKPQLGRAPLQQAQRADRGAGPNALPDVAHQEGEGRRLARASGGVAAGQDLQ